MAGKYAANTTVASEMSRLEIERTLIRYGASRFGYMTDAGQAMIVFAMSGKQIKFVLPLPNWENYKLTDTGRIRTGNSQQEAYDQACRQNWRALNLVVKAKLEAVACGISCFEDEFMANIVLPGGQTVSQMLLPQINQACLENKPMRLMLGD